MELKLIAIGAASVITGAVVLLWGMVQVYKRFDNPAVQEHLRPLLYYADFAADSMENNAKRGAVIMAIQQALAWRRIFLPMFAVGLILDILVKVVRKVGVPDLHQDTPNKEEAQP